MGIDDDRPRCMNNVCKKVWTYEFLSDNFQPSFHNKKYRNRRATLLHEREKSLLPGTQPLVAIEKRMEMNKKKIRDIMDETSMYRELIRQNDTRIRLLQNDHGEENHRILLNDHGEEKGLKKKKTRVFTRACPVEVCRGFLSTGLKCGTCDGYACKYCHLPKACKHDDDHKCDPDLVATVQLLAQDTKPCPACATPIFKIHGCDQMYCTQCHTAFSWIRGTIERGVIHNPHFYEAQRAINGGIAPSRHIAFGCGGLPNIWLVIEKIDGSNIGFKFGRNAHMLIAHIDNIELPRYPNMIGEVDNSNMRVDYLMNRITEKQWISKLKTKMKKQEKDGEFNMVLVMFTTTMADLFGNIAVSAVHDVHKYISAMIELREYTNNALKKIGLRYGNIYPCILDDFKFCSNAKKVNKPKKNMRARNEDVRLRNQRYYGTVNIDIETEEGEFSDGGVEGEQENKYDR